MGPNLIKVIPFFLTLGRENKVDYPERRIECHHMAIICTRNCDPLSMKKLLLKLNLLHLKCTKTLFPLIPSEAFKVFHNMANVFLRK